MDRGWLRALQNYNIRHVLAQTLNTPRTLRVLHTLSIIKSKPPSTPANPRTSSIIKSKPLSTIPTLVVLKDPLRGATPPPQWTAESNRGTLFCTQKFFVEVLQNAPRLWIRTTPRPPPIGPREWTLPHGFPCWEILDFRLTYRFSSRTFTLTGGVQYQETTTSSG